MNRSTTVSVVALTILTASLVIGDERPQAQTLVKPAGAAGGGDIKPLVWWWGPKSAVKSADYAVARDEKSWLELWARHTDKEVVKNHISEPIDAPRVDFDQCMVVAIFKGDSWNSSGVIITSITRDKGELRVRFDERTYQTAGPNGGGVRVSPYGLFVIPKDPGDVVIEENVQGLKNQPPKWRERKFVESPGKA